MVGEEEEVLLRVYHALPAVAEGGYQCKNADSSSQTDLEAP